MIEKTSETPADPQAIIRTVQYAWMCTELSEVCVDGQVYRANRETYEGLRAQAGRSSGQ